MSFSTQTPEGFVGCLKAQVSLDLRLADGMSFKTHQQVIDAESTYDILLGLVYRFQKSAPRVGCARDARTNVFTTGHCRVACRGASRR